MTREGKGLAQAHAGSEVAKQGLEPIIWLIFFLYNIVPLTFLGHGICLYLLDLLTSHIPALENARKENSWRLFLWKP